MAIDGERLKQAEAQFAGSQPGGCIRDARTVHSPHDTLPVGGDRGCDRMEMQRYADPYARALKTLGRDPRLIVEMGIFKGTGLAMWSVLFPNAEIIGLDIDPDRYLRHLPVLQDQGAFPNGNPEIYVFDELSDQSWEELSLLIEPGSVDLWIDDAIHRKDVILHAEKQARKFMAPRSVYLIEDNHEVPKIMQDRYGDRDGYDLVVGGEDNRVVALCRNP